MFSLAIINSARFLKMPIDSQNLYFHLGLRADDDGIVEAYPTMKMLGSTEDNLKVLVSKSFVKILNEDLVTFITDWKEHNLIRPDRKIDSIYKELLLKIEPNIKLITPRPRADAHKKKGGRPTDNQRTTNGQHRLGKDRLGKVSIGKDSNNKGQSKIAETEINKIFEIFYETINPTISYGNKANRKAAEFLIRKFGMKNTVRLTKYSCSVQGKTKYVPTITTPYQLKDKLAALRIYTDKQKSDKILSL